MRWKIFKVTNLLQLVFSSILLFYIILQLFRKSHDPSINWLIILWTCMNIILALQSMVHIHILNRYFPDRFIPVSVVITRVVVSVLSWITTAILLFGLGDIYFDEGSWKNLDKRIWLIVIVVTIFTINSLLCLILQSGLIRHIRKNNQTAILETVNQLGKSVQWV